MEGYSFISFFPTRLKIFVLITPNLPITCPNPPLTSPTPWPWLRYPVFLLREGALLCCYSLITTCWWGGGHSNCCLNRSFPGPSYMSEGLSLERTLFVLNSVYNSRIEWCLRLRFSVYILSPTKKVCHILTSASTISLPNQGNFVNMNISLKDFRT